MSSMGQIVFIGKGNPEPAKFVVVCSCFYSLACIFHNCFDFSFFRFQKNQVLKIT
jgi:hypothetical protein